MGSIKVDSLKAGIPDSSVTVLEASGVDSLITGAVSEFPDGNLMTYIVPGGLMGPNDMLRITALFDSAGGNGNSQAIMRLGGTTVNNGTIFLNNTIAGANTAYDCQRLICNQNSVSSQIFLNNAREETYNLESTQSLETGSVDMSVDQFLRINGTCFGGRRYFYTEILFN